MCGWSIIFLESYQGKLLKKKKKKKYMRIEWSPFLRAEALQGCQIQIKVIASKNIKVKKFGIISFSMPHCILIL